MDYLGFDFTPQAYVDLLAYFVTAGALVGALVVLMSLFHRRGY